MNANVTTKIENKKRNLVSEMADMFRSNYMELWWKAGTELLVICPPSETKIKRAKEKETDLFVKAMVRHFKSFPRLEHKRKEWSDNIMDMARAYARDILDFKEQYLEIIFSEGFIESTGSFIKEAKRFAPVMKIEDIFQAIRNVWIMNSIQVFLNKRVGFTNSIFSYSMLYPFTDNYLDSNDISVEEKIRISSNFRRRLAGQSIEPATEYEAQLFSLISKIEEDYRRDLYPRVYESLLGIHDAQQKSLTQQVKQTIPYETDIAGISFLKGGMSVLADAYLVNGDLDGKSAEFMFGFGILLQLADDLQDVGTDMKNGHMTMFSQLAGKYPLDSITNKLINFVNEVMDSVDCFNSSISFHLKELIKFNCNFLILQAVARNSRFYSSDYIDDIERYSMFGFTYLKKLYSRLQREYGAFERNKNVQSIDEIIYSVIGI